MRSYRVFVSWAGRAVTPYYTGTFDDLSGTGRYMCQAFTITRKMGDNHIGETKVDLVLNDVLPGRYNPKNTASALYGSIRPMRPCKVQGSVDGVTYRDLAYAWLEEGEDDPEIGVNQARFQFRDVTLLLERAEGIIIAATGQTTVGAAIGLILNAIGWDAGLRSLQTGDVIPNFSADGSRNGLQLIEDLLKVDLGYFYHSRQNIVTYVDRYEPGRRASVGTFQSAKAAIPGVSLSTVKNRATGQKEGSTDQTYSDATSITEFGYGDHSKVESPYFRDDNQALSWAKWQVIQTKDPGSPFWAFDVSEGPTGYLDAILQAEFLDKATISTAGLVNQTFTIKDMTHYAGSGQLHRTSWVLAEIPGTVPALVGVATVAPDSPATWGPYARVVY